MTEKEKDFYGSFAERMKHYRHKHGFTQQELADKADLSIRHISDIEMGYSKPSFEVMEKLADVLGLELTYNLIIESQNIIKR